jgi:hypothetical protein
MRRDNARGMKAPVAWFGARPGRDMAAVILSLRAPFALGSQLCSDANEYETVHCLACQQIHLINPATGKVVGDEQV